jgi:tripartite-type tricarboxylate transporter receptor subunit TctC
MISRGRRAGFRLAAAIAFAVAAAAKAQDFPANPVKIIVPFAAGGSIDVLARTLQPKLESELGNPVIVENRPGASTQLGAIDVARSTPDGYTILFASDSHVINQVFNSKPPYDAVKDFAPLSLLVRFPTVTTPIQRSMRQRCATLSR